MTKRLPRTANICDVTFTLRRPAKVALDGHACFATIDHEACVIDIERGLSAERAHWAFKHEVGHGTFDLSGANEMLAKHIPDDELRKEVEEDLIVRWLPAYVAALKGHL